jgi:transposase
VHEIAPVFLKDEGRIEALFTLYFLALLVQALIERELRLAMTRIDELPLYPEQRQCTRPTPEQILRMFSLAARHKLIEGAHTVQVFDVLLTDLQRQVLTLFGVSERAFRPPG